MTSPIFSNLRRWTQARIGLESTALALKTPEILKFRLAHAQARDAVHKHWNYPSLAAHLAKIEQPTWMVSSQVQSRKTYLTRPDLGRKLSQESRAFLQQQQHHCFDIAWIVSDGLSASAIENHLLPFWNTWELLLQDLHLKSSPIILAPYSRVAISDEVGDILNSRLSIIFVGERPGLSSADSLGIYLTFGPKVGNHDSNRNCISNVREPDGLTYDIAATKLNFLIRESLLRRISGVALKEEGSIPIEMKPIITNK
jgi:ethanolamine ammonia-lyase small subunit